MQRILIWLATAATLTFTLPASATQDDPRLDSLFVKLKTTTDAVEAVTVEQTIWHVWLESGDEKVDSIMARGLRAMTINDFAAALGMFDQAVHMAPDYAEGWNKRATVNYLLGNFEASVADIKRTLALEPRHFGALSGLGLVRLAQGDEAAALEAFEAALRVHPHLPGAEARVKELRERIRGKEI